MTFCSKCGCRILFSMSVHLIVCEVLTPKELSVYNNQRWFFRIYDGVFGSWKIVVQSNEANLTATINYDKVLNIYFVIERYNAKAISYASFPEAVRQFDKNVDALIHL